MPCKRKRRDRRSQCRVCKEGSSSHLFEHVANQHLQIEIELPSHRAAKNCNDRRAAHGIASLGAPYRCDRHAKISRKFAAGPFASRTDSQKDACEFGYDGSFAYGCHGGDSVPSETQLSRGKIFGGAAVAPGGAGVCDAAPYRGDDSGMRHIPRRPALVNKNRA